MGEQANGTSRLSRLLQSLHATQVVSQSSSARALTDVLVALAEEVAALQEEMQARAAARVGLEEAQALQDRLAALEREMRGLRGDVQRLLKRTQLGQTPAPQASADPFAETLASPVTLLGGWLYSGPANARTPLPREEIVRRLSMRRDTGDSHSRSSQGDRPSSGTTAYTQSRREKLLLILVPVAAVVVLVILFVLGAGHILMP